MTTIDKFYFHNATTANIGTLPSATASVSPTSPIVTPSGIVNMSMDSTPGTSQTSKVSTCVANTSNQSKLILRFISDPLTAQTIPAQQITVNLAGGESNLNSNFLVWAGVFTWSPGSGAGNLTIADVNWTSNLTFVASTEEARSMVQPSLVDMVCAEGDLIVCELWRGDVAQSMATAYTNTFFYDGTTEGSASNNAANLQFEQYVTMINPQLPDQIMGPPQQ